MEGSVLSIFLSGSALVLLSCILSLFYSLWWKPKSLERYFKVQGIHGPPYRFMYGNGMEMMQLAMEARLKPMKDPSSHDILARVNPFVHKTMMKYGKLFVTWRGTTPQVVVMDQQLLKEIFLNKSGDFLKMEITPLIKYFVTGLQIYDGEKWAKHRRIINPAFHMEKLKRMVPAFSTCCDELINKWEKLVSSTGSFELDVCPEFQNLTGDMISRAGFGSSFEEGRKVYELQLEQGKLFLQAYQRMLNPLSRLLPNKEDRRRVEIHQETSALLKGIIKKRQKAIEMGNTSNDDLLGLLLESNLNESGENGNSKNLGMTIDEVIGECKLFFFAGQETTANLLAWTMILLSMHPNWQERARKEVVQVFGNDHKPNFDDLNHLKIMTMIFHEVLRLYPPTSLIRRTIHRTKLGGFSIPPNTELLLPIDFVHRDPEQWGEAANEFNPERFSEGVSKASKDPNSYFPFGGGPRICIGQNFALIESKLALTKILQHFSFELSPSYVHVPIVTLTLHPQLGAQIILHKL